VPPLLGTFNVTDDELIAPRGAPGRRGRVIVLDTHAWLRLASDPRDAGPWVRQALAPERVETLLLRPGIAVAAALLDDGSFPGDPADRVIYATSRVAARTAW